MHKHTLLLLFMTLQLDVSKVSFYNLGYICTLLELLYHSESIGVISTSYAKVTISYCLNACNFNCHRNACKAMYYISSFHSL